MSHDEYDTFAMVVNFINNSWEPTHVTIEAFEMQNTTNATMANQVKILLYSFGLFDKVIVYVKYEGSNLNTLINALKSIVLCSPFQLLTPFVGSCFGHAMSKATRMPLAMQKFVKVFQTLISLKSVQTSM
jgi:hypothetical protein